MSGSKLRSGGTRRHGMSETPEYAAWINMRARCAWNGHPQYGDYGGRGITVCDRWRSTFEAFFADMGTRPSPSHTLERVDNEKGYQPDNCVWASRMQQGRNTRRNRLVEFGGRTMPLVEACELAGVNPNTAYQRAWAGKSDAEILSRTPLPQPKRGPRRS